MGITKPVAREYSQLSGDRSLRRIPVHMSTRLASSEKLVLYASISALFFNNKLTFCSNFEINTV